MLHVWKQFAAPNNIPGNLRTIGTTTSDATGSYSFNSVPEIAGKYTVFVNFAGSKAYYGSTAENSFFVENQPAAHATPTPASTIDLCFIPSVIGIIIAIVVVGAVILLVLKKRP
jgi:hypothetical protein